MASSIDEKVVQLTLDNKQFNQASGDTIDSLAKLKKALEFEGAIDSFDEIEKEIRRVDLSPIEQGVENVGRQFTILDTITDAVFRNLTNRAIDFGERTLKSLTVDQISQGWGKYAEQTGAVQTIMAATAQQFEDTGEQMEAVNEQLEKLTWFTDETSHRFNDMVSGIGKFTANNIDLETSVKAMEGIATWASLSGANANQASHAIYNLAQAVSTGSVKILDWRSIETASMSTTEFKQAAIETAEALGTLIKVGNETWSTLDGKGTVSVTNFTNELSRGWFTADVLLKTLEKYGGYADRLNEFVNETGVLTATAMNIVDNYVDGTLDMAEAMAATGLSAEDLTKWLEELGSEEYELGRRALRASQETKTFQEAIDYVKEAVSSGWSTSFKYIFGDYLEAKEWWSEIAEVMYEAFVIGGEIRNTVLSMWKEKGGRDTFLDGIRALIENVMGLLDIFKEAWNEVWYGIATEDNNPLENQAAGLLALTQGFKDFADAIKPTEETAQNLRDILKALFNVIKSIATVLRTAGSALNPIFRVLNKIAGTTLQLVGDLARLVNMGLEKILTTDRLEKIYRVIELIAKAIELIAMTGLVGIVKLIDNIWDAVSNLWNIFQTTGGGINGIIQTITIVLNDLWNSFLDGNTIANTFIDILKNVLTGAIGSIIMLAKTIWDILSGKEIDLNEQFGDVSGWFSKISETITALDIPGKLQPAIDALQEFAGWIYQFFLDLFDADSNIRKIFANIKDELIDFWKWAVNGMSQLTLQDVESIAVVAMLVKIGLEFATIERKFGLLVDSMKGTVGQVTNLIKNFNLANFSTGGFMQQLETLANKTKWIQIGIGITMMISALNQLAKMPQKDIANAIITLGVTMGMLVAIMKQYENIVGKKLLKTGEDKSGNVGLQFLAVAASLLILVEAMKQIQNAIGEDPGALIASFAAIGTLAVGMVSVMKMVSEIDTKGMASAGAAMMLMSISISALIVPVKTLAAMPIEEMATGVLGVMALLVSMGAAAKLMSSVDWKTMLTSAVAFTTMAGAILILSAAVFSLNAITGEGAAITEVILLMAALTGAMSLLGIVSNAMDAASILSLSAAMLGLSVTMLSFAGAVKVLSTVSGGAVAGSLVTFIALLFSLAGAGALANAAIGGLLAIAAVIVAFGAAVALIASSINAIVEAIAKFSALVAALGLAGQEIGDEFPKVIQTGLDAVEQIIRGFLQMIPRIGTDLAVAVASLIATVSTGIMLGLPSLIQAVMLVATGIFSVIARLGGPLMKALTDLVHTLNEYLPGLVEEIGEFIEILFEQIGVLVNHAIKGLFKGALAIFFGGMDDATETAVNQSTKDLASAIRSGQQPALDAAEESGNDVGNAYVNGMRSSSLQWNSPPQFILDFLKDLGEAFGIGSDPAINAASESGENTGDAWGTGFLDGASNALDGWEEMLGGYLNFGFTDLVVGKQNTKKEDVYIDPMDVEEKKSQKKKSPATEAGENAAEDWTSALTSGMTSPSARSSLGSAAKSQAQTIADAFSDEIDKLSRDEKLQSKLYSLWQAQNPNATDAEKNAKDIENQLALIDIQSKRAAATQEIYRQTLEAMGEGAKETDEAYLDMLDDQIKLIEMQNKLAEAQKTATTSNVEAFRKYADVVKKWDVDYLIEAGFSYEEIARAAATEAGVQLPNAVKDASSKIGTAMNDVASDVTNGAVSSMVENLTSSNTIETLKTAGSNLDQHVADGANENIGVLATAGNNMGITVVENVESKQILNKTEAAGNKIDQTLGDSLEDNSDIPGDAATDMANLMLDNINSVWGINGKTSSVANDIGGFIAEGMAQGIKEKESLITKAAEEAAAAAYAAAMRRLQAHSPSRLMRNVGMYYDQGFALGITDYTKVITKSATEMVDDLVDSTENSLDSRTKAQNYLQKIFGLDDEAVHVNVVMDLDSKEYDDKMSELERAYLVARSDTPDTSSTYQAASTVGDGYLSKSMRQLANTEAYRNTQLNRIYNLVDEYFTAAKFGKVETPTQTSGNDEPTNISFVQNLYSPKAISRLDTYRQTKRQFDTFASKYNKIKR